MSALATPTSSATAPLLRAIVMFMLGSDTPPDTLDYRLQEAQAAAGDVLASSPKADDVALSAGVREALHQRLQRHYALAADDRPPHAQGIKHALTILENYDAVDMEIQGLIDDAAELGGIIGVCLAYRMLHGGGR